MKKKNKTVQPSVFLRTKINSRNLPVRVAKLRRCAKQNRGRSANSSLIRKIRDWGLNGFRFSDKN